MHRVIGTAARRDADVSAYSICRLRPRAKPSDYACWPPTFGLFLRLKRFGCLFFR
jgi:hypothetical protein